MSEPYHYSRDPEPRPQRLECTKCGFGVTGDSPQDALDKFAQAGGTVYRHDGLVDLTCPKCGHRGRNNTLYGGIPDGQ